MRITAVLLLLLAATSVLADPAEEVRQAETAFAKAFADRDATAFFGFVADDANFLSSKTVNSGKSAVTKAWSPLLDGRTAPFSWRPERVVTNGAGDLGFSTGPVFDAAGKHIANYTSIWQKNATGAWKVVFDGPGAPVCPQP